jgi:hypothetical protein
MSRDEDYKMSKPVYNWVGRTVQVGHDKTEYEVVEALTDQQVRLRSPAGVLLIASIQDLVQVNLTLA